MTTTEETELVRMQRIHEEWDLLTQIRDIGESSKVLEWPTSPEMVSTDIAARASEMAYRRGVVQGAYFMLWRIHGQPQGWCDLDPDLPGYAYVHDLCDWREQGRMEHYGRGEEPPRTETPGYQAPGQASTWVYFVQDSHSGAIKIGKADRPEQRIKELQTGTPYPLTMLGVVPADRNTEADLQKRFTDARIRGEWFLPEPDLLAFINRWATQPEPHGPQCPALDPMETTP